MKKLVFLFACLFLMGIAAENVKAQNSATATANAAATIITPITIEKTVDLNFGAIVPSGAAGTVTVGTDNSRSGTGGVTLISQLVKHSAAAFTVTGETKAKFYVTLPKEVSLTSKENKMTVSTFYHSATGTLDGTGKEAFNVGATLTVAASQPAGLYEGIFDVTVTYQ